jgi:hypothetical protein
MNVITTIDIAFTTEWMRLTTPEQYWHLHDRVDKAYILAVTLAVGNIQEFIDTDMRTAYNSAFRERYHRRNLRILAYQYANILFDLVSVELEHEATFDPNFYNIALNLLKAENLSCPIYPCIPNTRGLHPEIEINIPVT